MPAPRPIVIALSLAVAGCGWAPLYADPQNGPASAELRAIHVDPIPERIGQRLELMLRNSLNPTGEPTKERYRLQTSLRFALSALGLIAAGTSTVGRVDLVATYRLTDLQTGALLQTETLHSQNSFALNPNQYSTVVGEYDAALRSAVELDEEIVTRLTLFLQSRVQTPKPS